MNKKVKAILFFLIIFLSTFFMFQNNINADYSGSGGTGDGSVGTTSGKGSWVSNFGFYIKVYSQDDVQKGNTIDVYIGSYASPSISDLQGWITSKSNNWYSHPEKLYDYLDIPYESISGDYSTLLSLISTTLNAGDYISIEPYTTINNNKYTFREISDSTNIEKICTEYKCEEYECQISLFGKCIKHSNKCIKESCAKTTDYNYYVWYAKPAVILSNAAKVGNAITVGSKTFTSPTTSCNKSAYDNRKFCGYSSNKNIGYGITIVRYEDIYHQGKVKISIKRTDTNQLIKTKNATFRISDSSGNKITDITTNLGIVEHSLEPGTYSVEEISSPEGFDLASDKTVSINITANQTTEQDFLYDTTCDVKLTELGSNPSVDALINLYKSYQNDTNLLNFESPSCGKATCDRKKLDLLCLSGTNKYKNPNFNENNLSCYDEKADAGGSLVFCQTVYNLENNLGTNAFYGYAGRFLIKQNSYDSLITIYDSNLNPVNPSSIVATSATQKICYAYNNKLYSGYNLLPSSTVSFGDNDMNNTADNLQVESSVTQNSTIDVGNFKKHVYELTNYYKLNPVYLNKISGKYSLTPNPLTTQTPIYGILSNFTKESGNILFNITYDGRTFYSDDCKFTATRQIIPPPPNDGKINLEFRIIDTNKPFNRNTNTNWCDNSGSCSNDPGENQNINYILTSNNSYNRTGVGPKYKITLRPEDIKIIRNYNQEILYDEYLVYCSGTTCRNAFVFDLINGSLNKYRLSSNISVIDKSYGVLSNKMIVKDS